MVRIGRTVMDGAPRAGQIGDDGRFYPFEPPLSAMQAMTSDRIRTHATGVEFQPEVPVDWTASLRDCVGFLGHICNARQARGVTDPLPRPWFERPAFYFANPASLHASTAPVMIPPDCRRFDFELEIAVVLSAPGRNLTPEEAAERIGGYVLYCDWSARDIQTEERAMQIGQGKGKDAAISLGPWILSAADASAYRQEDGFSFDVSVSVNGETVVRKPFTGMDWSFEELIAYSSVGSAVLAGDVIASGTVPEGCLMEHSGKDDFRGWLRTGDHVVLDAGPLGTISTVIGPSEPTPAWRRDHCTQYAHSEKQERPS